MQKLEYENLPQWLKDLWEINSTMAKTAENWIKENIKEPAQNVAKPDVHPLLAEVRALKVGDDGKFHEFEELDLEWNAAIDKVLEILNGHFR